MGHRTVLLVWSGLCRAEVCVQVARMTETLQIRCKVLSSLELIYFDKQYLILNIVMVAMPSWAIFYWAAQASENVLSMHVICDCTVALTKTFEDVEVEVSQNVTVHNGYVRPNRLRIHAAFSRWKHFCSPTLLLGQVQGTLIFSWTISAASTSSYSFLFWAALAPTLFSSSALPHLSPTSPSAFHSDFKACLPLPLPAFPTYLHDFSFQAADLRAAHFLTHFSFNPWF